MTPPAPTCEHCGRSLKGASFHVNSYEVLCDNCWTIIQKTATGLAEVSQYHNDAEARRARECSNQRQREHFDKAAKEAKRRRRAT